MSLVSAKLREFNVQCDVNCQFSDADISSLEQLVTSQQAPTPAQLDTLWRMMQWPAGLLITQSCSSAGIRC